MKKYSRRYGRMVLRTWSSGDGSVSFSWIEDNSPELPEKQIPEPVTESDVSEFLCDPLVAHRFDDMEIVMLGGVSGMPTPKLAKPVKRPQHTSRKLIMRGVEYEYGVTESFQKDKGMAHNGMNTTFFREGAEVVDSETVLSLCFFLNHEEEFRDSGLETREKEGG